MAGPADRQFVTLGLGAEVFAVSVAHVREILDYQPPFAIPEGPDYLLGLTDVRGRGTPTIDLRLKLGLPRVEPTCATRILVLDVPVDDRVLALGLVADRVIEVVAFSEGQIEGPRHRRAVALGIHPGRGASRRVLRDQRLRGHLRSGAPADQPGRGRPQPGRLERARRPDGPPAQPAARRRRERRRPCRDKPPPRCKPPKSNS